jgi:hypothetical protein
MSHSALPLPRESVIQRAILEFLAWRGIFVFRVNQQGVPLHDGSAEYRPSPTRGVADILGVLPGGRFLAIEVKRPGNNPTDSQAQFLSRVASAGGLAFVATSVGDVEANLDSFLQQAA